MIEAKYAEIRDLINRGTFRAILRIELPNGANPITERYFLAIKSEEDKEERNKERYVVGGHLDIMKDCLVHAAQTIQCVSFRIIRVVVKIKSFRIWISYVNLAYI